MRTTCLQCEQEGVETTLVQTLRGRCCPIHEAAFIEALHRNARAVLGLPDPKILRDTRGKPNPRSI